MNSLFTQPRRLLSGPIAEQLDCALEDGPMGLFIQVDEGKASFFIAKPSMHQAWAQLSFLVMTLSFRRGIPARPALDQS